MQTQQAVLHSVEVKAIFPDHHRLSEKKKATEKKVQRSATDLHRSTDSAFAEEHVTFLLYVFVLCCISLNQKPSPSTLCVVWLGFLSCAASHISCSQFIIIQPDPAALHAVSVDFDFSLCCVHAKYRYMSLYTRAWI